MKVDNDAYLTLTYYVESEERRTLHDFVGELFGAAIDPVIAPKEILSSATYIKSQETRRCVWIWKSNSLMSYNSRIYKLSLRWRKGVTPRDRILIAHFVYDSDTYLRNAVYRDLILRLFLSSSQPQTHTRAT